MNTTGERYAAAIVAQLQHEKDALRHTYTVGEMIRRSGLGETSFHRYTKGKRDIPMSALVALAEALDLTLIELVRRAEERLTEDD